MSAAKLPGNVPEKAIQLDSLTRSFGDFTAVDRISFDVSRGEVFGFLGANGAGKTTVIKMLTGLLRPSSGKAFIWGKDVYTETEEIRKNIGYMSQKFSLYEDLSAEENIRFFGGIYGVGSNELNDKVNEIIVDAGLVESRNRPLRSLPTGWKQKLAFSVAVLHNPGIVFLDEPTGGVDPVTRRRFWERIYEAAENGTTVFVTTHYMDEAEYCDRVSIMVDGRVKAIGRPDVLKDTWSAASIEDLFIKLARSGRGGEG